MAASVPHKPKPVMGPAMLPLGHHEGKPPIPLLRPVIVIGSRSSARIHLVSHTVSKAHALLIRSRGRYYLRDLASRSKLIINEDEVREADLDDGDIIKIGSFVFKYIASPSDKRLAGRPPQGSDAPPFKLEIAGQDFPYPIEERVLLIGRRAACDIHLLEDTVSTAHAVIFEMDGQRHIRDLGSRTGTFINGVSTHQHQLAEGDRIRIGETEMRYVRNEVAAGVIVEDGAPGDSRVGLAERATVSVPLEPVAPVREAPEPSIAAPPPAPELDDADLEPIAASPEPLAAAPEAPAPPEVQETQIAIEHEDEPQLQPASEIQSPEQHIDVEAIAPEAPAIADSSAEIGVDAPALSAGGESSSVAETDADKHDELAMEMLATGEQAPADAAGPAKPDVESIELDSVEPVTVEPRASESSAVETTELQTPVPSESDAAPSKPEEPSPRRGWRGLGESIAMSPDDESPETEPAKPQSAEPVLKFPDSITHSDDGTAGAGDAGGTAVLDPDALAADALSASETSESADAGLGLDADALAELIAPPPAPVETASSESLDLSKLESHGQAVEAPAEQFAARADELVAPPPPRIEAPDIQAIESQIVETAPPQPVAEHAADDAPRHEDDAPALELPAVEATTPAEQSPRPLIASVELPDAPEEPPANVEPIKTVAIPLRSPRRARKPKSADKVDAPLPLEAPSEPVLIEPAVAEQAPATPMEIVIEPTEPTNESALQEPAAQLALDTLGSSEPPANPLTDTTFERSVREFAGNEIGEIVEEPGSEQPRSGPPRAAAIELPKPSEAELAAETPVDLSADDVAPPERATQLQPPEPEIASFEADLARPTPVVEIPAAPAAQVAPGDVPLPDTEEATLSDEDLEKILSAPVGDAPIGEVNVSEIEVDSTLSAPVAPAPVAPTADVATELPDIPLLEDPVAEGPITASATDVAPPGASIAPANSVSQEASDRAGASTPPGDSTTAADPASTAGEPRPGARIPWGANQDNFLGGVPLNLKTPPPAKPLAPQPQPPVGDKAVKDLIDEIDSVAAKAESASIKPDDDLPTMGVIPPRPRKPGVFRSPSRRRRDELLPAMEPEKPAEPAKLSTSFDALVDSPLREMDVFSQMSPPGEDEEPDAESQEPETAPDSAADGRESRRLPRRPRGTIAGAFGAPVSAAESSVITEPESESELARRQKVVPEIPETIEGMVVGARRPGVTYAAEQTEAEARAIRKKYIRRVYALFVLMVAAIAGAGYWVYNNYGVQSVVEAGLEFKNLGQQTHLQRSQFQANQYRVLKEDSTRRMARAGLTEHFPWVAPAFLDDQVTYFKTMERASFSDTNPDILTVPVEGTDPEADKQRLAAIASAMFVQNTVLVKEAQDTRKRAEDIKKAVLSFGRELEELNGEILRLRTLGQSAPTKDQIKQIESQVTALEQKWNEAIKATKAAEAELERMKSAPVVPEGATTAPATDPTNDPKLKQMQADLETQMAKVNEARSAASAQANTAKQVLDTALDSFQKQVAAAQGASDNPELAAFIQSAQTLYDRTRTHTEGLINRQQQQFARLMELKQRMNEQMEARRIEIWKKDEKIQEYRAQLDIAERQHNAAVGGGLQKEAEEKAAQVELIKNMIRTREEDLPVDNFYKEAIQQLQVIVDSTRKDIEEDRTKTEALLTTLQGGFTSKQAIEKLPAEQKQLAAELQQKLEQINAARKQYNEAVDNSAADVDAKLKTQVTALQTAIEARRKELADENVKNLQGQKEQDRLAEIGKKETELGRLQAEQAEAQLAYFEKHKELRAAMTGSEEANRNAQKLDGLMLRRDNVQRNLDENNRQLESAERAAQAAVEPVKFDPRNIAVRTGNDRRLLYAGISCGAILLLFSLLILWNVHAAAVEAPRASIQAADLRPVPNGKNGSDEDHQPAVI
jgi:pSer/pThr/pTyr-binding forkhead associated (FHA) protein